MAYPEQHAPNVSKCMVTNYDILKLIHTLIKYSHHTLCGFPLLYILTDVEISIYLTATVNRVLKIINKVQHDSGALSTK